MGNSNFTFKNAIAIMLILTCGTLCSQSNTKSRYRLGLGIGAHLTGNAHGTLYNASISLYNGKNHFSLGPCFQKTKIELCGAGFRYMHMLTGQESFSSEKDKAIIEDKKIQLFVFTYAQYLYSAKLSEGAIRQEERIVKKENDANIDFSKFQTSTVDVFAGFGLNTKINQKLVWSTSIGFGTYYHINYVMGMYAERISPALMLSTALRFNYIRR